MGTFMESILKEELKRFRDLEYKKRSYQPKQPSKTSYFPKVDPGRYAELTESLRERTLDRNLLYIGNSK